MPPLPQADLLVTGASGFLGRAIMARARDHGLTPLAVTRDKVDQRDPRAMAALLNQVRPTHAIDAAGILPGAGDVWGNTALTGGWLGALDLADLAPRLVLIGSAAIYGRGSATDRATREDDPRLPLSDYGRAKLAALEQGRVAFETAGHDVQTGIVFNLMGRGQAAHMAPMVFIRQALAAQGGVYEVRSVDAVRDFLDVEDAADALIAMALRGQAGDAVNVASGQPTRIGTLLDALETRLGAGWRHADDPAAAPEIDICYGDPARLMARTGWRPRYDFDDALTRAIAAAHSA